MNDVEIRNARPEDVFGIQKVFHETWLVTYPNKELGITTEDIQEMFKDSYSDAELEDFRERIKNRPANSKLLVAVEGENVVGVCRIFVRENFNQLQAIYVLPSYQGKGIGKKFWDEALKFWDKNKKIIVQVATYNTNAIKFYESLGFRDNGKRFAEERHRMPISKVLIPEMEMEIEVKKYHREDFWNEALASDFTYSQFTDDEIREYIEKGYIKSPVLDYGCGKGELVRQLVRNGLEVTGIDISLVGLEQTKDLVGGKVKLIHGDYKDIEGQFKTITMKLVYAFVTNKEECLEYINKHLEQDGVLLLQTPVINDKNRDTVTKPGICATEEECNLLLAYFSDVFVVSEISKPTGLLRTYVCYK
jgi:ribosomal protein S18 acetylase RimI-like enzyme/2-polyprenyl-3-methyl-5-hydroxy-6-metoxy-1,4-benzoquinol methylase